MADQYKDEGAQKRLPLEHLGRRHFLKGIGFIGTGAGAIFADHSEPFTVQGTISWQF